jgi:very-short-patch-repair endonuclease
MRNPVAQARAAELRRAPTDAERRLWRMLRGRQLGGLRFRRQVPIGPYIADFACLEAALVIELDGGQHAEAIGYDRQRDRYLAERGYRVLRIWNHDVDQNIEGVLETVLRASGRFLGD